MKRYRLWALDVPDLHPDGFQPRLGGMRLFEGGDGGGGGDGTTEGIDAPASASSSADASTGYSYSGGEGGGVDYEALAEASRIAAGYGQGLTSAQTKAFDDTLAATGDVGAALDAMEAVTAQAAADVDRPTSSEVLGVYQDYMDQFGGSADLGALPSAATNALDLAAAQAAEELAASAAGDPTRAALYGDAGYGEGLTGAQTKAFDDTLAATGDIGQALVAMETVAAPAPAPASSSGFTSFGGFGRRGGFSGFGRSRSAAPPPALDAQTLKAIAQVRGPEVAAQAARAIEAVQTPVGIDDSGAGGVNFDAFVNDGTTEGIDAPASASSSADASTGYSYSGGEGTADTTTPVSTEQSTLADAIAALRSGNLADALSALRDAVGITTTPEIPPEEFVGPSIPSNVVGTGAGGILVDNEGNPVLSTSYGLPGEYVAGTPELPSELLELAAQARGMTVDELRNEIDIAASNGEMIGTTGLDRQSLEALQQAGYGGKDVGSGSQTVDQALASMQTNEFLTDYLPTILSAAGFPGMGAISSINTINRLLSGQTTPGQAITTELLGALARQFGVSPTVLTNILDGKFGDAAANQTKSLIYGTLARESGVPGSVLGIAAKELGITDAINPLTAAVDRAVTDVVPDQGFGLPGQVASGIDTVLDPVQEAITSGLGGLGGVLQEAGQGIASGIGTVTTGVGDLIGNLVDAITGGTGTAVDESGVGGVDPDEYDFKEDRVYETGGDGSILDAADLGFTDYGAGGAGTGTGSVGLPGEELGEGILTGVDEWDQALVEADTGGVYPGTGSVGLPGEELGEGILTGVDSWDQALVEADTGDVYGIGGGDTGGAGTGVGVGTGTGVDTGDAGGDTDVAPPPPPMIPATGGGTTQMFGNYYSRVPTGYQIVQGPYGPLVQYTYGNVALGGV